jgi:CHAT domain-containing protein
LGNNYDQLNYLGKDVQFVTLYDPVEFFTRNKISTKNKLQFIKLDNKKLSNLPFVNQLSHKKFQPFISSNLTFHGNLSELLISRGVLHLYGHGSLISNKDSGSKNIELPYESNSTDSSISKINSDQIVNSSLVVLNNCYSGYNTNLSSREYDRGIYLNLLNNGALNVIVSPIKTDDESSSKIFNSFYKNIAKGETTNDALYHAQLSYLNTNKGNMAHPKFWSSYRLITNYPYSIISVENRQSEILFYCLILIFISISVGFHLHVQMKHF